MNSGIPLVTAQMGPYSLTSSQITLSEKNPLKYFPQIPQEFVLKINHYHNHLLSHTTQTPVNNTEQVQRSVMEL